jgi:hypothetical protein
MTAPTIEQAQAICAIRDRLWQYTRKGFRRFSLLGDEAGLAAPATDTKRELGG